jgi:thioredoxin-dependent peroxiredoxin
MTLRMRLLAVATLGLLGAATVGAAAPPFSRPATNGQTITLAQYRGKKTVVLAFFPKAFTGG